MKDEDLKEKNPLWNAADCSLVYQKWVVSARCSAVSHSVPLLLVICVRYTTQLFIFSLSFYVLCSIYFFFLSMYLQPLLQSPWIPHYSVYPHLTLSFLSIHNSPFVLYNSIFLSRHGLYKRLYKLNVPSDFLQIFIFFFFRIGVRAVSLNEYLSCAMRATCFANLCFFMHVIVH